MQIKQIRAGSLEVICGPMFSGKSEELIRRLRRAKIAKQRVVVFKHKIDDRYHDTYVTSHNGTQLHAYATPDCTEILTIVKKEHYTVVGIDEVQFYSPEIIDTICTLIEWGIRVVAAGLDLDFRGVPFGPTPILLALADSVSKLRAICTLCGKEAHFSQRLINDKPAKFNDPIILIGGEDTHAARCRTCYEIDKPFSYIHYKQAE